ncbi:hypothetical protein GC194_07290 [bacterium]|nr:hypothetical protein [bacterium]
MRNFNFVFEHKITENGIVIKVDELEQIPSIKALKDIPRRNYVKLILGDKLIELKSEVGRELQTGLSDFNVIIHNKKPEINLIRLISLAEIDAHRFFWNHVPKLMEFWQKSSFMDLLIN